jgi:hypothetical protein
MAEATLVMDNLQTLPHMALVLEDLGYEIGLQDDFVAIKVPVSQGNPLTAVLTIDDARSKAVITCEVARYKDVAEDKLPEFLAAQSDANTRIDPFAFATITDVDDPARESVDDWVFVLIDSLPLGDLSAKELESAMSDLVGAMPEVAQVMSLVKESA